MLHKVLCSSWVAAISSDSISCHHSWHFCLKRAWWWVQSNSTWQPSGIPRSHLDSGGPTDYKHAQAGMHHEEALEGYLDEGQASSTSNNTDDALQAEGVMGETPML